MIDSMRIDRGSPRPLGATNLGEKTNFALFSKNAEAVSLCLFEKGRSLKEIALDPRLHRTGDVWHIEIDGLSSTASYGYRVDGPYSPDRGMLFDNTKILLDPYAKQVEKQPKEGYLGVVDPKTDFDWGEDTHLDIPLNELVVYEMHLHGFTADPSSGVINRGTYLGMIEKIPYLKELGVNAVEFLPLHAFNPQDCVNRNPKTGLPLSNYWGYSTLNFFSIANFYAANKDETILEFKQLVKALHEAEIEVILDVVFNHTSEGNEHGPTLSFKGLENSIYYMLTPEGHYANYSGCGNTFNCNHPVLIELICDSLRYFAVEMHVDGFRFDLASILTRASDGSVLENPPLIEAISNDPVLSNRKFIAEAWDAAGLYQVGNFPGEGWADWNGVFRDQVRRFIKGSEGEAGNFATRLGGSEDIYAPSPPSSSVNFITAHDGFTLQDLVSYNQRHNWENGEESRDGEQNNESWNCGHEGPSKDGHITSLRTRQKRNFFSALLLSQGVPMFYMGDERSHSKGGNNNSWSHNDPVNWIDWSKEDSLFPFVQFLIRFRKEHPILMRSQFLTEEETTWHGVAPHQPDWTPDSRLVAYELCDTIDGYALYLAFNANFDSVTVHLPWREKKAPWIRIFDTNLPTPDEQPTSVGPTYTLASYSTLVLKREL